VFIQSWVIFTLMLPTLGIDKIVKAPSLSESFKIMHHAPINMPLITEAHKHDFYMLLIVAHGSGTHSIDFENYKVSDFTVFFLAPGQAHEWDLAPETSGYQVLYAPKFLSAGNPDTPFFKPKSIPFLQITEANFEELAHELVLIKTETEKSLSHSELILQNRLHIILALLKRWYSEAYQISSAEKNGRLIQSFLILLEEFYQQQSNVAFYAEKLHVTPNYLNNVCKKESGQTAGEQIRDRILLEAKRMLTLTNEDIKEIAYALGFNDTSYFSRFFKKYTSQTPVTFRKKI